jgi:hypothetical protein
MIVYKSTHIKECWPFQYVESPRVQRVATKREHNVLQKYNKHVTCLPLVEMSDNEFFKALSEGRI